MMMSGAKKNLFFIAIACLASLFLNKILSFLFVTIFVSSAGEIMFLVSYFTFIITALACFVYFFSKKIEYDWSGQLALAYQLFLQYKNKITTMFFFVFILMFDGLFQFYLTFQKMLQEDPTGAILREPALEMLASLSWPPTILGLTLASLMSLLVPIYEEWVWNEFLYKKLYDRASAAVTFIILFSLIVLSHVSFIIDINQLVSISLFAGIVVFARYYTQSWLGSLAVHLFYNFLVFLPKWFLIFYV